MTYAFFSTRKAAAEWLKAQNTSNGMSGYIVKYNEDLYVVRSWGTRSAQQ